MRLRPTLILILALLAIVGGARADEFVQSRKLYLTQVGYMTDRDAAIQEHARQFCVGAPRRVNCHGRFSREYFEPGDHVWKLEGLYGFTARNPPYPDQVFEDIVDRDSIYYDCPKSWSNVTLSTNPGLCSRPAQPEPDCDTCDPRVSPTAGNPILITAGIK